jgi:tetratricopeptide (TPR) repeat protein
VAQDRDRNDATARATGGAPEKPTRAIRPLSAPPSTPTLEATDPGLASALLALTAMPTAANHRRVADAYRRLGVLDTAFDHLDQALALDRRDAAAYDGRARIWRDWGFPNLGLADAHRALYFAPASPQAYNTLGTLLELLGQRAEARRAFEHAVTLDAAAAYALNNLCHLLHVDGAQAQAADACRAALLADPAMAVAHNNLGLVLASQGDFVAASREFAAAAPDAASFNLGVAYFAAGRFADAADAFDSAAATASSPRRARIHARQSRALADRQSLSADGTP